MKLLLFKMRGFLYSGEFCFEKLSWPIHDEIILRFVEGEATPTNHESISFNSYSICPFHTPLLSVPLIYSTVLSRSSMPCLQLISFKGSTGSSHYNFSYSFQIHLQLLSSWKRRDFSRKTLFWFRMNQRIPTLPVVFIYCLTLLTPFYQGHQGIWNLSELRDSFFHRRFQ